MPAARSALYAAAVAFAAVSLASCAVPVVGDSPQWPAQFTISFHTGLNGTRGPVSPAKGTMWYDWTDGQLQAIYHGPNAVECVHFYNDSNGCTLQMNPQGLFAEFPDTNTCCTDLSTIHASPPDWMIAANYTVLAQESVLGVPCRKWGNPAFTHQYWDTVAVDANGNHIPARFSFPNPLQDYWFDTHSLVYGAPAPSVFAVPANCPPCGSGSAKAKAARTFPFFPF